MSSVRLVINSQAVQRKPYSFRRTINLSLTGLLYVGPLLHCWYCKGLPFIIQKIGITKTAPRVLTQMGLDQTLFAPVFLCGFYLTLNLLINGNIQSGLKEIRSKMKETLFANWTIWPVAMTINFWKVPVQFQVLFSNVVGLFWNVILSFIANKPIPQKQTEIIT